MTISQNSHLTFKANIGLSRHGWLRLTPAYAYSVVEDSLRDADCESIVLDPFAGTGTTGLVAAESGIRAIMLDINPFLVWLGRTKCRSYSEEEIEHARWIASEALGAAAICDGRGLRVPPMHRIERWWDPETLRGLASLKRALTQLSDGKAGDDLLCIAFCRVMIQMSNAAFNHQSMSFQKSRTEQANLFASMSKTDEVFGTFADEVQSVLDSASSRLDGPVAVHLGDARKMGAVEDGAVDIIFTSPPYSNRMSYIRELRPYMYWLGYLSSGKQAGELDWETIGGTWGSATSRLSGWNATMPLPLGDEFESVLRRIAESDGRNAKLLANYVHKYFFDMLAHFQEAYRVLRSGGRATYIVGNSTFYGKTVPTEQWYARLLKHVGFERISVDVIRKRNSNKKLFEFSVECIRP